MSPDCGVITVLVTYHSGTGNTEKMAQGVVEGAKGVSGTSVVLKRVADVAGNDLLSSDAFIVGSPVYFGNMSGEVKMFFDNWTLKFQLFQGRKMRNKVGAVFATGIPRTARALDALPGTHEPVNRPHRLKT